MLALPFSRGAQAAYHDAAELASFLGLFNGATTVAALLVSLFAANRIYARSLVSWTAEKDSKLVGDLATDTGTMTDSGKTWKFTLKGDAKWQDGQPLKCDDVRYGISRTFATDVIHNGTPRQSDSNAIAQSR